MPRPSATQAEDLSSCSLARVEAESFDGSASGTCLSTLLLKVIRLRLQARPRSLEFVPIVRRPGEVSDWELDKFD